MYRGVVYRGVVYRGVVYRGVVYRGVVLSPECAASSLLEYNQGPAEK